MPFFEFRYGEPVSEIWAAMHFPAAGDTSKREMMTADARLGAYLQLGVQDWRFAEVAEAVASNQRARPERAEIEQRFRSGALAGEALRILFHLHLDDPSRTSWRSSFKILMQHAGVSERTIWNAKEQFGSVAHLWAIYSERNRQWGDIETFLADSMALLQWAQSWVVQVNSGGARRGASPLIDPSAEMWTPPPTWNPPAAHSGLSTGHGALSDNIRRSARAAPKKKSLQS